MPALSQDSIREQLQRVLTSPTFARSERLRRFLQFTVEESLSGAEESLKEYRIGIEVFGRGQGFDPRIDNIVRSHAHRLRGALQAYYDTDGAQDPVLIEFPKGAYVPTFAPRSEPAGPVLPAAAPPPRRPTVRLVAVGAVLAAVLLAAGYYLGRRGEPDGVGAFAIDSALLVQPELRLTQGVGALSPDGRLFVFPAVGPDGRSGLWLRSLASPEPRRLPASDGGHLPFWSPDASHVAFFANQKLKILRLPDGPVQVLCEAPAARGGSWSAAGVILFAPQSTDVLYQIPADGGTARPATRLDPDRRENAHRWPFFLDGGKEFLFFSRSLNAGLTGFYLGKLGSDAATLVLAQDAISNVVVGRAPHSGQAYLLYVQGGSLMARPFDAGRRKVTGSPRTVASGLPTPSGAYAFSVGGNLLTFWRGSWSAHTQLTWVDRTGKVLGKIGSPGEHRNLELSPDGSRLAFVSMDEQYGATDIWLMDMLRGGTTRFASDPANEFNPLWSPDGREIVYTTEQFGLARLVRRAVDGGQSPARLFDSAYTQFAWDWSRDGRTLVYGEDHIRTHFDLWAFPLQTPAARPFRLLASDANEREGRLSPDGRFLAYVSDKSGGPQVCVRAVGQGGAPGPEVQVSVNGGTRPRWDPDGKRLYYLGERGALVEASFPNGQPRALFSAAGVGEFAMAPAADRFLIPMEAAGRTPTYLPLLVNWTSGLP